MARSAKTPRFEAFNSFINCFGERQAHAGIWQKYLPSDRTLVLEIGCARAEFLLELARRDPKLNFIGIDKKADRLFRPAKTALDEKTDNVAFIQTDVQKIDDYIKETTVDEIWLTFPDPYPKDRQAKHRMTGTRFLELYYSLLKSDGVFNLKTDDKSLFDWSLGELEKVKDLFSVDFITNNLHAESNYDEAKILTVYERKFIAGGLTINYLRATKK